VKENPTRDGYAFFLRSVPQFDRNDSTPLDDISSSLTRLQGHSTRVARHALCSLRAVHDDADSCVGVARGWEPRTQYSGMSREQAYGKLRRGLLERGAAVTVDEPGRYLQARIPYGTCTCLRGSEGLGSIRLYTHTVPASPCLFTLPASILKNSEDSPLCTVTLT